MWGGRLPSSLLGRGPGGALRSRKRSEPTAQNAGCLKQPVQLTCSSVSPSLRHHTISTMHAPAYSHPPTLSSSPPIPPHFLPHHSTLITYLTCTSHTPSHSPFNAHYSPNVYPRPSHPQHLHTHPIPQHSLTRLRMYV